MGYKLEFDPDLSPPEQTKPCFPYAFSDHEKDKINQEITKLEAKNVIEQCEHTDGEFISNIFVRPKKNGGIRVILDLSDLNEFMLYQHFKMDSIHTAILLIQDNCFLASVDLQDAYYTVPVHESHRKYLRFVWQGVLWQYKVLPNGLSSAPRLFTKLLKPVFSTLRQAGHLVVGYLDDILVVGSSEETTLSSVNAVTSMLEKLGFLIHPEKSELNPVKELQFLGFHLNTVNMRITLPREKQEELRETCTALLAETSPSIREVARVIGKIVATFPAVQYGPLHYRRIESDKVKALKANRGHYDRRMKLSQGARLDLRWWIYNIQTSFTPITRDKISVEIQSDASGSGWGATDLHTSTGGRWNMEELAKAQLAGINFLEIRAAFLALQAYCKYRRNVHVLIRIDNVTAVTYLNNMGGMKSPLCNDMARHMWEWCTERDIWLSAAYLPGKLNVEADRMSRTFNDRLEWRLSRESFQKIVLQFGTPEIDLFASRLNAQLPRYISWLPDPKAESIDAFSVDWKQYYFYAFPPFCLVARCLQKILNDNACGIVIVPNWPTQAWFPLLRKMMIGEPLILPGSKKLLTQPISGVPHPLSNNLDLLCCRLGATNF